MFYGKRNEFTRVFLAGGEDGGADENYLLDDRDVEGRLRNSVNSHSGRSSNLVPIM